MQVISHRYQLQQLIGKGGMGSVYQVYDRLANETVALKRLTMDHQNLSFNHTDTHTSRMALTQEFSILSGIRHPHIVTVIDYGFDDEQQPYFTMDLLPQAQTIIDAALDSSLPQKYRLLWECLHALNFMHRRGIVHRDLKPANVLVSGNKAYLLDFGLAVSTEHLRQQSGKDDNTMGTLAYLAPEVIHGSPASFASDLYAFGLIAYELLSGKFPFDRSNVSKLIYQIISDPVDLSALDDMPDMLLILERLLLKSPDERYPDVPSLMRDVAEVAGFQTDYETADIRESYLQSARFVGRQAEQAQLQQALTKAADGQGSVYLLGGESGVGKSRLVELIQTHALVDGALVLRGQGQSEGGNLYELWRPIMRHLCLTVTLTDFEAAVIKQLVPDIATLLGRPIPDAQQISAADAQRRLFDTILELFRRREHPTVLILEDLHWAEESLLILTELARIVAELPTLIIGTYRNDERPALAELVGGANVITLARLTRDEIEHLSRSMLGGRVADHPALVDLLQQETEGNALFIVEVVRMLAEDAGMLEQIMEMALPEQAFTGGMKAVLQRRLAKVDPTDYAMLEAAAVAGRQLQPRLMRHLYPKLPLQVWFTRCASVLDVQDNQWRFAHDKLREIILSTMAPSRQTELHAKVADGIRQTDPNPAPAVLAYHYQRADQPRQEYSYRLQAGQAALENATYREALRAFQRAADLAAQLALPTLEQVGIQRYIGEAYIGLGDLGKGYTAFIDLLAPLNLADQPPPHILAQHVQAMAAAPDQHVGQIATATDPDAQSYYQNVAQASETLSIIHYFQNDKYPATYYALVGLDLALQTGAASHNEQARLRGLMSIMASLFPLHNAARRYYAQANEDLATIDSAETHTWVALVGGVYATNGADWALAIPALKRAVALTEETGNIRRYLESLLALAAVYYFHGMWDESFALGQRLEQLGRQRENRQAVAWGLDDQARIRYRRGDHAAALPMLAESGKIYDTIQDTGGTIWVHGALASIYTRTDDLDAAEPHAKQAFDLLRENGTSSYGVLEGYRGMMAYYLHRYQADPTSPTARQDAAAALDQFYEYANVFSIGHALKHLYTARFAEINGDLDRAGQAARAALKTAISYQQPYEIGLSAYHLARMLGPKHMDYAATVQQAETSLSKVGATYDLDALHRL